MRLVQVLLFLYGLIPILTYYLLEDLNRILDEYFSS